MKLFVSTDMEGVSGVASWSEMNRDSRYGDWLNSELGWILDEMMTHHDFDEQLTEMTICDSHARGENIPFGNLPDPRITYIRGYPRPYYMMQGLDATYDAVLLIGYHARIGAFGGGMDHSYSSSCIYNIRINDRTVGETEINAMYAGLFDVPVVMISGDDVLEKEMVEYYGEEMLFVRTKEGIGRYAAKMYHPETIEKAYREQTAALIRRFEENRGFEIKKPDKQTVLEVDLVNTVIADALSVVPGLERIEGRTVRYSSENYSDVFQMILTIAMLGGRFSDFH
ncbi:MAG TPA: M55 family metallopeptidase [Thermotogota bacterium]|nr:M55 family metallopeptidase [Thermotogota bacterium]HPR96279.1 M55 family metallopeptidase [Thermotogota bacterium]